MTLAYWCVLIVGLMPYVTVGIAKWDKSFDNQRPRDWLARQEGVRARAHAAHLNCFEALPLFAAAVIIAHQQGSAQPIVDGLAAAFVLARVAYVYFYLSDKASARSVAWTAGLLCTVGIFLTPMFK